MKNYERPYTYEELVKHYGKYVANKLSNDPCHKWRMETGIELIHKEPDLDDQKKIWKNWQLMSDEAKQKSDEKCIELFGMTNERLNSYILKNRWNGEKNKSKFNAIYEDIMKESLNKNNSNGVFNFFSFPLFRKTNFNFLNSHSKKTYELSNNIEFNLTEQQLQKISSLLEINIKEFKHTFEYLLNGYEFEAWVANTCEEFEDSELTINEFKDIIENFDKFKNTFEISDNDKQEMYLFSEICYLSYLNNKNDDRYWYLIEALKENKNE